MINKVNCYIYDILSPELDDNFLTGHATILTAILRFMVNSDACLCSHNFCILSAVALSYVQIVKCLRVGVFCLKCNFFRLILLDLCDMLKLILKFW